MSPGPRSARLGRARRRPPTRRAARPPLAGRAALLALAAAVALGTLLAAGSSPAGAHAQLVGTTPSDGARLDQAPTEVTLTFSEGVSVGVGQVRVLDPEGERVDRGGVTVQDEVVTVPLRSGVPDGSYVVAWRAVSADSHPIDGAFTFGVGEGATDLDDSVVDALVGESGEAAWRIVGTGTRIVGYGGALLAAGLAVFLVAAHDGGPERGGLRRAVRVAAAIGAAGLLAELPVRAALATGLGPGSITEEGVLGQILSDGVGLSVLLALLALAFLAFDAGRDKVVVGAGLLALGVALALAGHTATASPAAVAIGADAAHVVAGATWLGGLAGLLVLAWARRGTARSPLPVALRFSGVAAIALWSVVVAGVALGWTQVGSVQALVSTPYGQLLLAKVAIVALVATLGGWNRYRLLPALEATAAPAETGATETGATDEGDHRSESAAVGAGAGATGATDEGGGTGATGATDERGHGGEGHLVAGAGDGQPGDRREADDLREGAAHEVPAPPPGRTSAGFALLRRTLVVEVALLALVVGVTAALVDVTPARSAVAAPYSATEPLGDGELTVQLEPTRAGRTTLHIYAYDAEGQPWVLPEGIEVRFSLPASDVTGIERTPADSGPGHWTLIGDDLSIPGTWTVEIAARTSLYEEETATFQVRIV